MPDTTILQDIIEKESCISFHEEWLNVADYELKILILSSILAENNFAYRGTLKEMCEWLGVKSVTNNHNNIKAALKTLQEKEYIFYKLDGRTYTITISEKGMKQKQIVRIRKAWIAAFKKFNSDDSKKPKKERLSIAWIKILRVFVYLYSRKDTNLITAKKIADDLNIHEETVRKAINAMLECNLKGLRISKTVVKDNIKINNAILPYNLGTDISFIIMFND